MAFRLPTSVPGQRNTQRSLGASAVTPTGRQEDGGLTASLSRIPRSCRPTSPLPVLGGSLLVVGRHKKDDLGIMRRARATEPRSRRNQRGQSLIEFAITVPFLLLLLAAAIDFGMGFSSRLEVANAARVGARWASLHSGDVNAGWSNIATPDDNTIQGQVLYAGDTRKILNDNAHIVIKYFVWTSSTNTTTYCGKYDQVSNAFVGAGTYTQPQCVAVGNIVQLSVYYDYPLLTPLFASMYGKTLSIGSAASFVIQS